MGKHTELPDFIALEVREWDGDEWPEKRVSLGCPYEKHAVAISPRYSDIEQAKTNMEEIAKRYSNHARLVEALRDACGVMEAFNRAPGATRDEWEFECEVEEIKTLLAQIDGELE